MNKSPPKDYYYRHYQLIDLFKTIIEESPMSPKKALKALERHLNANEGYYGLQIAL